MRKKTTVISLAAAAAAVSLVVAGMPSHRHPALERAGSRLGISSGIGTYLAGSKPGVSGGANRNIG